MAPVDLDRFYTDQEASAADPFGADIPQCPLGIWMNSECVYDELGFDYDPWRYQHDEPWRLQLNKAYNDKAETIVGRRLLKEAPARNPSLVFPEHKKLHDVFEASHAWHAGSWWLEQVVDNEDELRALLDRVERRLEDLRAFILPPEWEKEKQQLMRLGATPPRYRSQRGPVTFATSIYGPENLIFLINDNPDLAGRLRDLILQTMLGIARILDEEAGDTPHTAPHGFSFADDNCCLLTPDMYEFFGYPILNTIFDRYSPNPGDRRFQHSDSSMGHLLPVLGRLRFTAVNFGPTVMVDEIRTHIPDAVIQGQLAPFTFSRNEEENIVAEFLRDFERAGDQRGLMFATAGSINNGSRLTGLRLIMAAIQRHGHYA
ncbi:MAG: uroporphyrinogen decarboxylase family protein [bacterium]